MKEAGVCVMSLRTSGWKRRRTSAYDDEGLPWVAMQCTMSCTYTFANICKKLQAFLCEALLELAPLPCMLTAFLMSGKKGKMHSSNALMSSVHTSGPGQR